MRIKQIQIKNFRAFHGATLTVDLPKSENLIVYGENGSGKTSLFLALKDFFANVRQTLDITAHPRRNFFAQEKAQIALDKRDNESDIKKKGQFAREAERHFETFVKVKFEPTSETASKKLKYEWTNKLNDVSQVSKHGLDITKGFIDYKGLLQTYFLHVDANRVNVFDFLVQEVLPDVKQLTGKRTFGEAWSEINEALTRLNENLSKLEALPPRARRGGLTERGLLEISIRDGRKNIELLLDDFNTQLNGILSKLSEVTNDLLVPFKQSISLELEYALARLGAADANQDAILAKEIDLQVSFYDRKREQHHQFLNEARLSAIAIALYFASFLVNPQAGTKVLALDDVLIGLDMANRLPVLDILEEYFPDYQIFLFTFDKHWYQALQHRFPTWEKIEFYTHKDSDSEMTFAKTPNSLMLKANEQIRQHSYESAANLIRSYYEEIIKEFCSHLKLRVPFSLETRKLNAGIFWKVICDNKHKLGMSASVITRVDTVVKSILNPLSHAANVPMTHADLIFAKQVLEDLDTELNRLKVTFSAKDFSA
jgi:energy-coupling factor transporter ATP-binding protein EcfA2